MRESQFAYDLEFEFRVWDNFEKRMKYKVLLYQGKVLISINPFCGEEKFIFAPKEQYEIMQYTGAKDKNGKKIFRGDIVRLENGGIAEITQEPWKFNMCATVDVEKQWDLVEDCMDWMCEGNGMNCITNRYEWAEIIGNRFENPELIRCEK